MATPISVSLLDHFAALSDPRQRTKVLYPLPEILLLVLSATIAGADDFVETTVWGTEHLAVLRRFYRYSRRSHDRRKGRNPLHLVSAWASRQQIVLGQQATEEKSNEITAIPLLLKHLDLTGALVTMDAMGTQTDIARAIRAGGGDYCMSLKKNWPAVYADVEQLFSDPPDNVSFETKETVDLTGGRIETRRHTVCHKVDWMTSDRHYPGEPVFPDLAMIGRIETEVERNDKIERETRYYLCSIALCALTFARVVRAHWGVENRLHWVLDVIFREDLARLRTGDEPQNMAIIRHTTLNLLSRAKPTVSLKNRRKRAGWNVNYLETLIRQTA
jgi:predicted transposase YbfD/YdcC